MLSVHAFISYSRENQKVVKILAEDLQALGPEVWLDQQLTGGQAWWDEILSRIRQCDLFVFALSPVALSSQACKREYIYAFNLGKRILPVLVAEGVSMGLLPPELSTVQFVDYRRQDKQAGLALSRSLQHLPAPQPLPDPLPEPPEVPISYLSSLKDRIESPGALSFEEQSALVVKLKEHLSNKGEFDDTCTLLRQLRERDDLFAKVSKEIDVALANARVPGSLQNKGKTLPALPAPPALAERRQSGRRSKPDPAPAGGVLRWARYAGAAFFGIFGVVLLLESLRYGGVGGILMGIGFLVVAYAIGRTK